MGVFRGTLAEQPIQNRTQRLSDFGLGDSTMDDLSMDAHRHVGLSLNWRRQHLLFVVRRFAAVHDHVNV